MPIARAVRPQPFFLNEEQLKSFFKRYDMNKDGVLDRNELKQGFQALGAYFPGFRAQRALADADNDNDSVVSEQEMDALVKYAIKFGFSIKNF